MKNKAIKITIIILSILLLAMLTAVVLMIYRQENEVNLPGPAAPDRDVTAEEPEPLPAIVEVASVTIVLESDEILRGTRFWPEVIVRPDNATDKFVELHSDNEFVLRLQGGFFTALELGRANLIATASNGVSHTVAITVKAPDLEAISFDEEEMSMLPGEMFVLSPVITPREAFMFDPIDFSSSDRNVATVAIDGRVTAVGPGTAVITASVGDISGDIKINVVVPARRVNVILTRRVYSVGDTAEFTIEVDPPNATNASVAVSFSGAAVTSTGSNTFRLDEAGEVVVTFVAENGTSISHTLVVHDLAALAAEVLRLTNIERQNVGVGALGQNEPLTQSAYIRASEIIQHWSHTRPDGQRFETVFEETGVQYIRAGENLAAGQRNPAEAVRSWMTSTAGHREALLSADYGNVGIGVAMDEDGRLYWTQLFTD